MLRGREGPQTTGQGEEGRKEGKKRWSVEGIDCGLYIREKGRYMISYYVLGWQEIEGNAVVLGPPLR